MTPAEFTKQYEQLINVHFKFDELVNNSTITIRKTDKVLTDFLEFYVPRYSRYNHWDNRPVEQIILNESSTSIRLKDVIASPAEWGLDIFHNARELSKTLWPIPIATDTRSRRTLILDSNHTICTLLIAGININVPCIEVMGENLSTLGTDLKLMGS